jgi:hypothetical protein
MMMKSSPITCLIVLLLLFDNFLRVQKNEMMLLYTIGRDEVLGVLRVGAVGTFAEEVDCQSAIRRGVANSRRSPEYGCGRAFF